MYLVIGKENCGRCTVVKNILTNKNIRYEYVLLEDMSEDERKKYMKMARDSGIMSMPIIIKDNNIIDLQEVK